MFFHMFFGGYENKVYSLYIITVVKRKTHEYKILDKTLVLASFGFLDRTGLESGPFESGYGDGTLRRWLGESEPGDIWMSTPADGFAFAVLIKMRL